MRAADGFMALLRPMLITVLAVATIPLTTRAGPLVLEETARISSPEAGFSLAGAVAIDGDFLVVTGARAHGRRSATRTESENPARAACRRRVVRQPSRPAATQTRHRT